MNKKTTIKTLLFVFSLLWYAAILPAKTTLKPLSAKLKDQFLYSSPVIADLLNNGSSEVILAGSQQVYVMKLESLKPLEGWPKELMKSEGVSAYGTPAVGSI